MIGVTGVRRNGPSRQILREYGEDGTVKDIAKPVHKAYNARLLTSIRPIYVSICKG